MALAFLACSAERGEIVVLIDSDFEVPSGAERIVATVRDGAANLYSTETFRLVRSATSAAGQTLPLSFVVAAGEGFEGDGLDLEIALFAEDGTSRVSRRVTTQFEGGTRRLLPIFLAVGCVDLVCGAGQACSEAGCVPERVEPEAMKPLAPGEAPAHVFVHPAMGVEHCDGVDNDGDGLADERFEYTETPGVRRLLTPGKITQGYSAARAPSGDVLLVWQEGAGDPNDVVVAQLHGPDGRPLAEPVRWSAFQPSNINRAIWVDGHFAIVGQQRKYACPTRTDCPAYLATIAADGTLRGAPQQIYRGRASLLTTFALDGEIVVARGGRAGPGLEVASYRPDGTLGTGIRAMLTLTPTTADVAVAGASVQAELIYWMLTTSEAAWLWSTDRAGVSRGAPISLGAGLYGQLGPEPFVVRDGVVTAVYKRGGDSYQGRWTTAGQRLSETPLARLTETAFVDVADGQMLVLLALEPPNGLRFARVSLGGVLLQAPSFLASAGSPAFAATSGGAVFAATDYLGMNVLISHVGCPLKR